MQLLAFLSRAFGTSQIPPLKSMPEITDMRKATIDLRKLARRTNKDIDQEAAELDKWLSK